MVPGCCIWQAHYKMLTKQYIPHHELTIKTHFQNFIHGQMINYHSSRLLAEKTHAMLPQPTKNVTLFITHYVITFPASNQVWNCVENSGYIMEDMLVMGNYTIHHTTNSDSLVLWSPAFDIQDGT